MTHIARTDSFIEKADGFFFAALIVVMAIATVALALTVATLV